MSEKSLRSKLIRLAHSKPELREHLLPLITKEAIGAYYDGLNRKQRKLLDKYMRKSDPVYYNFDDLPRRLKGQLYDLDDLADEFRYHNGHYQLEESVEIYIRENHRTTTLNEKIKYGFLNERLAHTKKAADPLTEFLVIDFQDQVGNLRVSPKFMKGIALLEKGERYGIQDFLKENKNELHKLVKKMNISPMRKKQILSDMYKY